MLLKAKGVPLRSEMSKKQSSAPTDRGRGPIPSSSRARVQDYIDVADHCSLTSLIEALEPFRTSAGADEMEVTLVGDDDFGRRLRITYFREVTAEEAALERKYQTPAAAIPTRRITLRPVNYAQHTALLWGDDGTGIPPSL